MARQLTNRQAKRSRKSKGFTLIELMVVTAIAGVLGGVAVPKFLQAREAATSKATIAEDVGAARECQSYLNAGEAESGMKTPVIKISDGTSITCADEQDYALTLSSGSFIHQQAATADTAAVKGITCLGTENTTANAKTVTVTASLEDGLTCAFSA